MPKTSMNEDRLFVDGENDVGSAGKFMRMKTISASHAIYQASDNHLRMGMFPSYQRHNLASFCGAHGVHGSNEYIPASGEAGDYIYQSG